MAKPTLAIMGRPNVGKSSLFNALVGHERAIVTEVPGTTRDAIEAPVTCGGFPFRLVDTAGLRATGNRVERLGVEVSHRYLDAADVVIFCGECGCRLEPAEEEFLEKLNGRVVMVRTKADISPPPSVRESGIRVSAISGEGLPELRTELARFAFAHLSGQADLEPLVTRERHRAALQVALEETEAFRDSRIAGLEGNASRIDARSHCRGTRS